MLHSGAPPLFCGLVYSPGQVKQRNSKTLDACSELKSPLSQRVTCLKSVGRIERRQNDGDFIPDGKRHILAANGRDEEEEDYSAGEVRSAFCALLRLNTAVSNIYPQTFFLFVSLSVIYEIKVIYLTEGKVSSDVGPCVMRFNF